MNPTLFGYMPDGKPVYEYTLTNEHFSLSFINYGGIIHKFVAYDTDIIGGFDTLDDYLTDEYHQGSLVGRYANRIAGGKFTLDGQEYILDCNSGNVHLHGGHKGFSRSYWQTISFGEDHVTFRMISPDGDQHYPGNLVADVTYTLLSDGLKIDYTATTDVPTPVNLTNHAYFNLSGDFTTSIFGNTLTVDADEYSLYDDDCIPLCHKQVEGTPFDFRSPHLIGDCISPDFPTYDHNYILSGGKKRCFGDVELHRGARLENDILALSMYTDQPCMQLYIGFFMDGKEPLKGGIAQVPHRTVCLEAQTEPNGPNRGEAILRPGETYRQTTIYVVEKK